MKKMKVLVRLLFYFTEGKSNSLSVNVSLDDIKKALDRLFKDKE